MIPSWAKVGAKVQCIDGARRTNNSHGVSRADPPPQGSVVEIVASFWDDRTSLVALVIKGFPNPCPVRQRDAGWDIARFKPLITKTQEQDIEMFLRIANDTPFHVMIDEELYPID